MWNKRLITDIADLVQKRPQGDEGVCVDLEHVSPSTGQLIGGLSVTGGEVSKLRFSREDVLFAKLRPYLKKAWLSDREGICSSEFWVLKAKKDMGHPGFLRQFVLSEPFLKACAASSGSKMPRADWSYVETIKFPLPPLAEQRKIAETLRTWDEAIEAEENKLTQLKLQLEALISRLTLRQCIGTPDKGWHDARIGQFIEEVDRDVEWDDAKTFSLISCGRRASGIFLREKKSGSDIDVKKMYEVQAGDFIVSQKQSAHAGWGMVTKEFQGHHVSPMYTIYGLKGKGLHMPFFNWLCKTPWMRHQAYLSSYGVHIEKMSFVSRLFLKTKIRIPTLLTDQEKACAVLEGAENEIKAATLKLAKLNDQKRGLMQKLLTGEVRVIA